MCVFDVVYCVGGVGSARENLTVSRGRPPPPLAGEMVARSEARAGSVVGLVPDAACYLAALRTFLRAALTAVPFFFRSTRTAGNFFSQYFFGLNIFAQLQQ